MKEKIAVLTDSTCDLEHEIIERYGIEVLPLKVIYQDRVYLDRGPGEGTVAPGRA